MFDSVPVFADPVRAMHSVSQDLGLARALPLADGSSATALELQWELLRLAQKWADRHGTDSVGGEIGNDILERWEAVLAGLETDVMSLATQVDWIAKLRLFDGYRQRHDLEWSDPRLAAMDLQYHDLRAASSLGRRVGLETIVDEDEVARVPLIRLGTPACGF